MTLSLSEFASKLSSIVEAIPIQKTAPSYYMRRLQDHFGKDPTTLAILRSEYSFYEHPCIQLALEQYLSDGHSSTELVGIATQSYSPSLAELIEYVSSERPAIAGPIQYLGVDLGDDGTVNCVERGLYLLSNGCDRLAVCLLKNSECLSVEVMGSERSLAEKFLKDLKALMSNQSVYRGRVLSLDGNCSVTGVKLHKLDPINRNDLILPNGLLERLERHTIRFSKHKEALATAGLSLKRGVLLHGNPGTGKTLTVKYLLGQMEQRTTVLVHGCGIEKIETVCQFARKLEPATIVIEDVDLIAEDRRNSRSNPLLVDLLNEMDGLANDMDMLFLLTTNRAEILEPALASRPGRIDQAIAIPLPDDLCRRRLFDLYGKGLHLEIDNMARFVDKTKGASPAFIRELLRQAALFAAEEGSELHVRDRHLDAAMHRTDRSWWRT